MKKNNNPTRVWKIVAISFIVIFVLFVFVGLIKSHNIKSSFVKPSQDQIELAKRIAAEKLQSANINASTFQITVGERGQKHRDNKVILQVVFYNDTTTHAYLVDLDSGKVILHSETEIFEKISDPRKPYLPYPNERVGGSWRPLPTFFEHKDKRE